LFAMLLIAQARESQARGTPANPNDFLKPRIDLADRLPPKRLALCQRAGRAFVISLRSVHSFFPFGVLKRRDKGLVIVCAAVAFGALMLIPILPAPFIYTGPCCGQNSESISFKYLGYGFMSGYVAINSTTPSSNRYYTWCHRLNGGFSCEDPYRIGSVNL
jgi:hypothetical protein